MPDVFYNPVDPPDPQGAAQHYGKDQEGNSYLDNTMMLFFFGRYTSRR